MHKSIRLKIKYLLTVCLLLCGMNAAAAESMLLAETEIVSGDSEMRAELWGDRLASGYADNLLLLLKNEEGKIKAAYNPSIKGGYNCILTAVNVCDDGRQLLVAAGQGNWQRPTEYRIVDFSDAKNLREIFSAADNYGVLGKTELAGDRLMITVSDGSSSSLQADDKLLEEIIPGRRQVQAEKLHSLTVLDIDNDGRQEVLTVQKICADKKVLADVGAVWKYDAENGWEKSGFTILVAGAAEKNNSINDGREGAGYTVLPRKIAAPGGEATYPVTAWRNEAALQSRVNEVLRQESKDYLEKFVSGEADMAFNVLRADKDLLSIQLISGKKSFVHHHVNIDPQTGKIIRLEDILQVSDPDLLPLLQLLNTNEKVEFTEGLPTEWYLSDKKLCLIVDVCGQEEVSCYAIGNLHKFLLDKKWLN